MALQMTWQVPRRKSPPVGLKNLGNTCYLNSVLQCLTFTPPFANFCHAGHHSSSCPSWNSTKGGNCPFCLVERRIVRSLGIDSQVDAPVKMVNSLHLFSKQFRHGRQEDAHEFLRFVIDACDDVSIKIYKAQNKVGAKQLKQEPKTIIKEIFGGVLQSQIKCLSCGAESNKFDEILDINLDILDFGSLKEGLCRLSQSELLDGSNKYNCEKCKKLSAARKQLLISQAPNVLVIQLKRFEDTFGGKIDRHIIFEEHLDLSAHMSRASQDPRPEYTLFGTVVHSGYSQDSGHYYAYVKDVNARWYCCNDAHVSAATIQAVLAEKVYMLFFLRSNSWPKRGKEMMPSNGVDRRNSFGNGDVSMKQGTSTISNTSVGVASRGSLNNGATKLHLKPQLKIANLKHASSHLGKTGIIENGNGTCKSDTSEMESESFERNASGKSYLDASFSSNSSMLRKEESLMYNKPCEPNCRISNGKHSSSSSQSSLPNKVSEHSETNGQCCKNDSIKGNILKNLSDGDSMPGSNGHLHVDKLQNPTSNASCNYKTELSRPDSKNHVGEYIQSSFPDGSDGSKGKRLFKRRKEEHENMYAGNGHTEQVDVVLKHNFDSKVKSDSDGVENPSEIDKLKEILCQEAREHLQSCGWCDDVRDAMQAKKRICVDQMHLLVSNVEYREFLIQSVRDSLIRQIPDSLKGQLLDHLRSFFKGKR